MTALHYAVLVSASILFYVLFHHEKNVPTDFFSSTVVYIWPQIFLMMKCMWPILWVCLRPVTLFTVVVIIIIIIVG